MSVRAALSGFVERRRSLAAEHYRIERIAEEAALLVEELRLRRDGIRPRRIALPHLRQAIDEVDPSAATEYGERS